MGAVSLVLLLRAYVVGVRTASLAPAPWLGTGAASLALALQGWHKHCKPGTRAVSLAWALGGWQGRWEPGRGTASLAWPPGPPGQLLPRRWCQAAANPPCPCPWPLAGPTPAG